MEPVPVDGRISRRTRSRPCGSPSSCWSTRSRCAGRAGASCSPGPAPSSSSSRSARGSGGPSSTSTASSGTGATSAGRNSGRRNISSSRPSRSPPSSRRSCPTRGAAALLPADSTPRSANGAPFLRHVPGRSASAALLLSCAGLFAVGIVPDVVFPLVWVAPPALLISLAVLRGERHALSGIASGDWRSPVSSALAALLCGFFWEMWNFGQREVGVRHPLRRCPARLRDAPPRVRRIPPVRGAVRRNRGHPSQQRRPQALRDGFRQAPGPIFFQRCTRLI